MNQPVRVVTGQAYGQAQALENAQRAIPLPNNQNPPAPAAAPAPSSVAAGAGLPALAGQQDFTRPTERPNEPVTTGLPSGPGLGPEALSANQVPANDPVMAQLVALYRASGGDPHIQKLIELRANGFGY